MEPSVWIEALKQAPALAFMVYIVTVFLKHIEASRKDSLDNIKEITAEHRVFQGNIAAEHKIALARVAEAIDKNNHTLGRTGYALDYLAKSCPAFMPKNGKSEE